MTQADEIRQYVTTFELREVEAVGVGRPYQYLHGRAVPYETWADLGWFMEQHAANSFKASTSKGAGKTVPLLLFHDNRSFPVGKAEQWRHDDGGLDGVWKLNDSPQAQRAAKAADDGELVGLSVGFSPIRSKYDRCADDMYDPDLGPDHMDKVTRLESRLIEVSLTPTPAYVDAGVTLVRSLEQRRKIRPAQVEAWRNYLEEVRSAQP